MVQAWSVHPILPRRVLALLAALAFWGSAYFYTGGGGSQQVHYGTARALVERGSFTLDPYPFMNVDVARAGGHTLSNKPPGFPILIAPAAFAGMLAEKAWPGRKGTAIEVGGLVTQVLSLGLAGFILLVLLTRVLAMQLNVERAASLAALGYLGTYLWPFSTTFFSHIATAALAMGVAYLLASAERTPLRSFLAGLLLAWGPLIEFSAAMAFLPVGVWALWSAKSHTERAALLLGCVPPAAILLGYQAAYFGGPLEFSYSHLSTQHQVEGHSKGFLGAGWPRLPEFLELTIGYYRGLFLIVPLTALGLWGLLKFPNQGFARAALAGTWLLILFISGYWAWQGGSSFGPRFLLPVIPWLLMGLGYAWQRRPRWVMAAAVYGGIGMLTGPSVCMIPHASHTPGYYWLVGFLGLKLLKGQVPAFAGDLFGESTLPPDQRPTLGLGFNLGHVVGLNGLVSVIPFVLITLAIVVLLHRDAQRSESVSAPSSP